MHLFQVLIDTIPIKFPDQCGPGLTPGAADDPRRQCSPVEALLPT